MFNTITNRSILLAAVLFGASACGSSEKETKVIEMQEAPEAEDVNLADRAPTAGEMRDFKTYETDFQSIVRSYRGVLRNHHIYDTYDDVMAKEQDAELVTKEENKLVYKLPTSVESREALVEYNFKDDKLNDMKLDIVLNDNAAYELFLVDFTEYFTHKYGTPTMAADKEELWKVDEHAPEHEIDIIDKPTERDHHLQVVVY